MSSAYKHFREALEHILTNVPELKKKYQIQKN